MGQLDRAELSAQGTRRARELREDGVELVAMTFVDNSGILRTKAVPVGKLASAAAWGVGASNSFDFFLCNDVLTTGAYSHGPVGDLRLHPDLSETTVLAAQPGWAWAPANRYDTEGVPHPQDSRALAAKAVELLAERGYRAGMSFEIEWVVTAESAPEDPRSATAAPAYGYARLSQHAGYLRTLMSTLDAQTIEVVQIHPEYASGQFELSMEVDNPVGAADMAVLAKETIREVSRQHGLRASFTPKFVPGGVGNGGHVHLSLWQDETNLCAGGDRRYGLTPAAESFGAGIFSRLPALLAIGAPSVVSYLRLEPHHWAGVFTAWGLENREAPLRFVQGAAGERERTANFEVKCFDLTANPYLVVAALLFSGMAGIDADARLPEPLEVDPGSLTDDERAARGITRLPQNLAEAVAAFESDEILKKNFGAELATTLADVRRGEIAEFAGLSPEELCATMRWLH